MAPQHTLSYADRHHLGIIVPPIPGTAQGPTVHRSLAEEVIRVGQVTDGRARRCITAITGVRNKAMKYIPTPLYNRRVAFTAYGALGASTGTVSDRLDQLMTQSQGAIEAVPLTALRLGGIEKFFPGPGDLLNQHARLTEIRAAFQSSLDAKVAQQEKFAALASSLRHKKFSPKAEGLGETQNIIAALDAELARLDARKNKTQITAKKQSVESALSELKNLILHRDPRMAPQVDAAIIANASGDGHKLAAIFDQLKRNRALSKSELVVLVNLAHTLGQGNWLRVRGFLSGAKKAAMVGLGVAAVAGTAGLGGAVLSWWGATALAGSLGVAGLRGAQSSTKVLDGNTITASELGYIYRDIARTRHEKLHPKPEALTEQNKQNTYAMFFAEVCRMGVGTPLHLGYKNEPLGNFIIDKIEGKKIHLSKNGYNVVVDTTIVPFKCYYRNDDSSHLSFDLLDIDSNSGLNNKGKSPFLPALQLRRQFENVPN